MSRYTPKQLSDGCRLGFPGRGTGRTIPEYIAEHNAFIASRDAAIAESLEMIREIDRLATLPADADALAACIARWTVQP